MVQESGYALLSMWYRNPATLSLPVLGCPMLKRIWSDGNFFYTFDGNFWQLCNVLVCMHDYGLLHAIYCTRDYV